MRFFRRLSAGQVNLLMALTLCVTAIAFAQGGGGRRRQYSYPNVEYDGRFQLVRLRYVEYEGSAWAFDYPAMEENLMVMFEDLTAVRLIRKASNIFTMDDPKLNKFPVSYLCEPGYWYPSDAEALGMRKYLQKGGFLIVDDFFQGSGRNEWGVFYRGILKVLPNAKVLPLDLSQPVFDVFFRIRSLDMTYPMQPWFGNLRSQFLGIFEDNDPHKRLIVAINYNNDLGEYMEFSDQGLWPVDTSNDAYKFMMNYIIYGLAN